MNIEGGGGLPKKGVLDSLPILGVLGKKEGSVVVFWGS